jgi:beta-fructofuranosidase
MSERAEAAAPIAWQWRPRYHVTGERNWINDPNGPIHHDGIYHLFYQANPNEPFWGPPRWGHVSSTDLVTWTRHRFALTPEPGGPDADGCWSGCARVVGGRPAIYYTGVVGEGDDRIESVCRAWGSDDMLRWQRDDANPLIAGPGGAATRGYHRDPFLWRDDRGWHMLLGSGTKVGPRHGQVLRYDSADATSWTYGGVFFDAARWHGSLDLGEHWECPQLVIDGDAVALILSCQTPERDRPLMHSVAWVGAFDGDRFHADGFQLLDHGDVLYAPAVCRDAGGRDLMWGWAQERLPADPQTALAHAGALTLPREVQIDGGRLRSRPVPELDGLRLAPLSPLTAGQTAFRATWQMELSTVVSGSRGRATWMLTAAASSAPNIEIAVDLAANELQVSVDDDSGGLRSRSVPLLSRGQHALRVFVDGSLIEVFVDDDSALTTRSYVAQSAGDVTARLAASDGIHVASVAAWALDANAIDAEGMSAA